MSLKEKAKGETAAGGLESTVSPVGTPPSGSRAEPGGGLGANHFEEFWD